MRISTTSNVVTEPLLLASAAMILSLGIPLVVLGVVAGRVLTRLGGFTQPILRGYGLSLLTCLAMIVSVLMFLITEQTTNMSAIVTDRGAVATYWALKYTGVFFGILSTLAISVVFEAAVIFRLHRKPGGEFVEKKVLNAVLQANLLTIFILSVAGAAYTISTRLQSDGFLFIN